MLRIIVGHSTELDERDAVEDLVEQIKPQLEEAPHWAGVLFTGMDFEHAVLLEALEESLPGLPLIGCTTAGEMSSVAGFEEDSVLLMVLLSDEITFGVGASVVVDSLDQAATEAVNEAKSNLTGPVEMALSLPEGLHINNDEVVRCLRRAVGLELPIFGGTAGDQWRMNFTYQFCRDAVMQNSINVLLFQGPLLIGHGVSSGRMPLASEAVVTRSEGDRLYEIDGLSALQYYKKFQGEGTVTPDVSIAVYEDNRDAFYIRAPFSYDEETESVTYFGDVPMGATIRLASVLNEDLMDSVRRSVGAALERYPGERPALAMLFSCATRKNVLGSRTPQELALARELLPEGLPVVGFYTYGEIGPHFLGMPVRFHNETLITMLIGVE